MNIRQADKNKKVHYMLDQTAGACGRYTAKVTKITLLVTCKDCKKILDKGISF
jgi:hypothetical protein